VTRAGNTFDDKGIGCPPPPGGALRASLLSSAPVAFPPSMHRRCKEARPRRDECHRTGWRKFAANAAKAAKQSGARSPICEAQRPMPLVSARWC